MNNFNRYAEEQLNNEIRRAQTTNNSACAADVIDVGLEITGGIAEGAAESGDGLLDFVGDLFDIDLDDAPIGIILAIVALVIGGIGVLIYKLVKHCKKK